MLFSTDESMEKYEYFLWSFLKILFFILPIYISCALFCFEI